MRIHRLKVAGVAAVTALALAACSGTTRGGEQGSATPVDTSQKITLSFAWWGNDDRAGRYEKAIDLFEKKYPNITVQTQFAAYDDYWPARSTEAAGRALPDVFQMDMAYLRQYASTNLITDLNNQVGVNLNLDGFDDTLLTAGSVDGRQVAVPTSVNTLSLIYNTAILDKLGIEPLAEGYTWDDLNRWIEKVSRAGGQGKPAVYGSDDYGTTILFVFLQWVIQQGKKPFTEDGKLGFDKADVTTWLQMTQPLRSGGNLHPIARAKQLDPLTGFTTEESASIIQWDTLMPNFASEAGTDTFKLLPMPSGDNGPQQFWKPAMLLSTAANSSQPDAAAALIDFLVNDPEVGKIFGTTKGVPAVAAQRDAMDLKPGTLEEQVVAYEEAVAEKVTEPTPIPVEGFGTLETEFTRLGEELQYGKITVDRMVDEWFAIADDTIR